MMLFILSPFLIFPLSFPHLFLILSLFLICAIAFTVYLVAITVRDARRKAEKQLSERKKDRIALAAARPEFIVTPSCCDCDADRCDCDRTNGEEEPTVTDFNEEELRIQVK